VLRWLLIKNGVTVIPPNPVQFYAICVQLWCTQLDTCTHTHTHTHRQTISESLSVFCWAVYTVSRYATSHTDEVYYRLHRHSTPAFVSHWWNELSIRPRHDWMPYTRFRSVSYNTERSLRAATLWGVSVADPTSWNLFTWLFPWSNTWVLLQKRNNLRVIKRTKHEAQ